ncbi:hypothetical protein MLD38_020069 [Melastoma candidum]|uniref:Uncharacterized protein n=1 Tax=Melastoma candidum TaxID=119954 RepID=A0ACB9QCA6_9MYRT|nr:hypothetical protein MLD38_020069 [Melastoma candidum]
MEENQLFDIIHPQVKAQGTDEEISRVADLANRCLDLNGRSRPTMKEVAAELEEVRNIKFPSGILGGKGSCSCIIEEQADGLVPVRPNLDAVAPASLDELPLLVTTSW